MILRVGDSLFHKQFGMIKVLCIDSDGIRAETDDYGIQVFKINDFGNTLFLKVNHCNTRFSSFNEYARYCDMMKSQREIIVSTDNHYIDLEEFYGSLNQIGRIRDFIDERAIKKLVHFTRIENLLSILKNGLIPRCVLEKDGINCIYNDTRRLDERTDCISCSFEFPNYKLFYRFRNLAPEAKWVVVAVSKDILFSPNNKAYFCHTNAAAVMPQINKHDDLCTAEALETMFKEIFEARRGDLFDRSVLHIGKNYTTDPQAEILIRGAIDRKYITSIYFNSIEAFNKFAYVKPAKEFIRKNYDFVKSIFVIDPSLFDKRKDYKWW